MGKEGVGDSVCAVTALNAFGAVRDTAGGFMAGAHDGDRIIDPGSMPAAGDVG